MPEIALAQRESVVKKEQLHISEHSIRVPRAGFVTFLDEITDDIQLFAPGH